MQSNATCLRYLATLIHYIKAAKYPCWLTSTDSLSGITAQNLKWEETFSCRASHFLIGSGTSVDWQLAMIQQNCPSTSGTQHSYAFRNTRIGRRRSNNFCSFSQQRKERQEFTFVSRAGPVQVGLFMLSVCMCEDRIYCSRDNTERHVLCACSEDFRIGSLSLRIPL